MILNHFSFFVGFILLILIPVILLNNKNGKKLNIYFLIILGLAGLQRFINGLVVFNIIDALFNPFQISLWFAFFIPPLYFLFFQNLLNKSASFVKVLFLFTLVPVIILTAGVLNFNKNINQFIFLFYSFIYLVVLFKSIRKYVFNRKNQLELTHYKSIKIWAIIMFSFFILMFIFTNYIYHSFLYEKEEIVLGEFNNRTSFIWFFIVIYILMNPIILYGEQLLQKKLNKSTIDEIEIWKKNKLRATEYIDKEVEKKVKPNIEQILLAFIKFENSLLNDFCYVPTLKEVASKLDYPQSHIKYIFKYYSHYSFSEYRNVLKIKYALKLIHDNYLSTQTIDSLSQKCLFKSRNTFFINFKNLMGYSTTDYYINFNKYQKQEIINEN